VYVTSPEAVNLEDVFKVNISFSGNNISGADFILSFNNTILSAGKIYSEQTEMLTSPGNKIDNNNGKIFFAFAFIKNKTISGNGNLAVVEFTAKSIGKSEVIIDGTKNTPKILRINKTPADDVLISNTYILVNNNTTRKTNNQASLNNIAKPNNTTEFIENIENKKESDKAESRNTTRDNNSIETENNINENVNENVENTKTKDETKEEENETMTNEDKKEAEKEEKEYNYTYAMFLVFLVILAVALILVLLFKKMKTT